VNDEQGKFILNIRGGDLDRLKERVAAFGASEVESEELEPLLRKERLAFAAASAALSDADSAARYPGLAEPHRLLLDSGLRELLREPEEQALADGLLRRFTDGLPPPGPLLAAMLLFHAFELPLPKDLDRVPHWLLLDYARFLLLRPRIFHQPGDGERYARFLDAAVALLRSYIVRQPPAPLSDALGDIFVDESRFTQAYFNEANLRQLYRNRAEIIARAPVRAARRGAPAARRHPWPAPRRADGELFHAGTHRAPAARSLRS